MVVLGVEAVFYEGITFTLFLFVKDFGGKRTYD